MHGLQDIEGEVNNACRGHHQYDWVWPRRTWLDATCPAYIYYGEKSIVRLETYEDSGLLCIRLVAKRKFFHATMIEESAAAIASRFCRLPD